MNVDGCHLCRKVDPFDAMTVDMVAKLLESQFTGKFELIFHAGTVDDKQSPSTKQNVDPKVRTNIVIVSCILLSARTDM